MPIIRVVKNIPNQPSIAKISVVGCASMSIKAEPDAITNRAPIIPLYFHSRISDIPNSNSPTTSNSADI